MNRNDRERMEEMKKQMNREYFDIMPDAMAALQNIIKDPDINPIARVQAVSLVMDRVLGRPEENIRIQHMEDNMNEAQERLDDIFAKAKKKKNGIS